MKKKEPALKFQFSTWKLFLFISTLWCAYERENGGIILGKWCICSADSMPMKWWTIQFGSLSYFVALPINGIGLTALWGAEQRQSCQKKNLFRKSNYTNFKRKHNFRPTKWRTPNWKIMFCPKNWMIELWWIERKHVSVRLQRWESMRAISLNTKKNHFTGEQ